MAIDTRYMLTPPIWQVFTNKDTNEFLFSGYVLFFEDTNRMVGKPVYQITGSPPAYSYIQYGFLDTNGAWRVDLNTQGAFTEAVYLFPYDVDGNPQNYFIQWYSSDDILQESREGWPNVSGTGTPSEIVTLNYAANSQFLYHTTPPATGTFSEGEIRQATTEVAYGGWSFDRPNASTATDFVTFERFNSYTSNPPANPRFACRVKCTSPNVGDLFKDLTLTYSNVNKFASTTQEYTFAFSGVTNSGSSTNVQLVLIKNFGTGGSPSAETETILTTFSVTNSYSVNAYSFSFLFGNNAGETLGTNNDDFVSLALRYPVATTFDVSVTGVILTVGEVTNPVAADTPDFIYDYSSFAGFLTDNANDGSTLYLPVILGPKGLTYDFTDIGRVYSTYNEVLPPNGALCDGSVFLTSGYSATGVPLSRLWDVQWDDVNYFNSWGNGSNFVTLFDTTVTAQVVLTTNTFGSVTATSDGGSPTGFTFGASVHAGSASILAKGFCTSTPTFYIWNNVAGGVTQAAPGTSGFTVKQLFQPVSPVSTTLPGVRAAVSVTTISAAGLAGKYFLFSTTMANYYLWMRVDLAGADPAVGGRTGIQVDLLSTMNDITVANICAMAINSAQMSTITFNAGSLALQNTYWLFYASTNQYLVWYNVNGLGVEPNIVGKINIEVPILSTDTNVDVLNKTKIAINGYQYALPDLRGKFLRGWDGSSGNDPDALTRFQAVPFSNLATNIGTDELFEIYNHSHSFSVTADKANGGADAGFGVTFQSEVEPTGGAESRPINNSVLWIIKY